MILRMWEENYEYFPTLREIKDGLVEGQLKILQEDKDKWEVTDDHQGNKQIDFEKLKQNYADNWEMIFRMGKLGNMDAPLTSSTLKDPNSKITKHLLYIYSMQSFIYEHLNKACREKEEEPLKFFGPYAAALSYIIHYANLQRKDKLSDCTLYRGLSMEDKEIESYKVNENVYLEGYTSSTKEFSVAEKFALENFQSFPYYDALEGTIPDVIDNRWPVIFEISFNSQKGLFNMSEGYSAYPEEGEVLIQDGLMYTVTDKK